ncbi:MAG: helix-turn-helix domain-containing protein [Ferruginibacter sp.]
MFYSIEDLKKIVKEAVREELLFGHFQIRKDNPKSLQSQEPRDIYSVEEAAGYLHMSIPTLRKNYTKKIIKRIQQGRKITFKKVYLEEYLEKYTIK